MATNESTMTLEPVDTAGPIVSDEYAVMTLPQLERVIERGIGAFVDVGRALVAIRDRKLYKEAGFATFADYCRETYQVSRPYAYHLMAASAIVREMSAIADIDGFDTSLPLPTTESVARPLVGLVSPEARAAAWQEVVALHGANPTAADVREVVSRRTRGGATIFPANGAPGPAPVIDVATSLLIDAAEMRDSALTITIVDDIIHAYTSWRGEQPSAVADRLSRSVGGRTNARRRVESLIEWLHKVAANLEQE